ncbi:MAG: hypothetical protein EOO95_09085, partial [Pedobacter sp.]
ALDNKGYNKGNKIYQASFIGFFPSEKPMYTMAVVIQNSRESKKIYGADVSGAVFKEISDKIFNFSAYNIYRMNGQNFNLIDTEVQFNPVKGSFKYSLQGKNLANLKAFTNLNINEVSSSNFSSSILGRYAMVNVSMSIK